MKVSLEDVESLRWSEGKAKVLYRLRDGRSREYCCDRIKQKGGRLAPSTWAKLELNTSLSVPMHTLRLVAVGVGLTIEELVQELTSAD